MSARWDRIMLAQRVSRSRTVRRLTDGEFRAFIAALCLAGQSPIRGHLLVSETVACTEEDIADEAGVKARVAGTALEKLQQLGTLALDEQRGCLFFPKWSVYNPAPRPSDRAAATRERKRRQRARERQEKAKETEKTQTTIGRKGSPLKSAGADLFEVPPKEGGRKRVREAWRRECRAFATEHYGSPNASTAVEQALYWGKAANADEIHAWIAEKMPSVAERRAA